MIWERMLGGGGYRWRKSLNVRNAFFLSALISIIAGISSIAASAATIPTFKTFKKGSIENGVYVIASHDNPGYVVDLAGGNPALESNVQLYSRNGTQSQQWYFGCVDPANDIYEIRPMRAAAAGYTATHDYIYDPANTVDVPDITHMAMDVSGGGKTDGANVQIYSGNGTGSQRWKLIKRPNGSYRIQALSDTSSTPFLLNIAAEPANYVNMQMWHEYSGIVRTEFDLEKVDDGITRVSSKTLEPVDKNAEPIRYSRLQVRDDLQPAGSKPVIDTAYTNTRYQDLTANNISTKKNSYYNDDDEMCGSLYSSQDGKAWTPLGDSSVTANNYAYKVNNATKKSSISLTKTPDKTSITGDEVVQGKTIGYTFTITNTGSQTLDNIKLTDSKLQSAPTINWGSPKSPTLAPGKTVTATGTYTLTRDDVSNKPIENTATVTATDELGRIVTSSSSATVTPSATSSVFVSKAVSPSTVSTGDASVGETLTWKIYATNNGNQTLAGVTFHDTLDGLSALDIDWDGSQEGRIAPGKSAVATATYRLAAADVKRGYVKNEAYVTCNDLRGNSLTSNHATATATIAGKTGLSLEKTTDTPSISADEAFVGNRIKYTIKVTNTGNRELTGLAIADAKIAPSTASPGKTELGAGESTTATVSYAITDADIKAGKVINTATATATDSDGKTVTSNQGTATTTIETPRPGISVTKEVDKTVLTGDEARAGTKLTYTISVTNTGNVPVGELRAVDGMEYDGHQYLDFGTIRPGKTVKLRAQHTVTQDEVDAGKVVNEIVVSNWDVTAGDSVETSISPSSSLTVSKTVDTAQIAADEAIAGKRLTYTITVRNNGSSTVTGVSLADELNGASVGKLGKTTLAPGEQTTATATYSITAGDIAAGSVVNAVTVKGTAPSGKPVTSNRATARTNIEAPRSALSVSKTVDKTSLTGAEARPGTKLSYTITVTNGGNSTVSGIRLDDSMDGASGPLLAQLDRTELAAGETATARVSYTVTQSDIDRGRVTNTVQASGTGVGGSAVTSGRSSATTSIEASDSITVSKAVDKTEIPPSSAVPGTELAYTFTVRNTGTRTLKSVSIADSIGSIGKITPAKTTLAPGEETTATAPYRITAADIKA